MCTSRGETGSTQDKHRHGRSVTLSVMLQWTRPAESGILNWFASTDAIRLCRENGYEVVFGHPSADWLDRRGRPKILYPLSICTLNQP